LAEVEVVKRWLAMVGVMVCGSQGGG